MEKVEVVIAAGGTGSRFDGERPKLLAELNGKPLISYCLEVFENSSLINGVILVVPASLMEEFQKVVKKKGFSKIRRVIAGGKSRGDSVYNGLKEVEADTTVVMVHDGARPFMSATMLEEAVKEIQETEAVIFGVPVKATIKEVDSQNQMVQKTLDRRFLWEIQTPQAFKKEILITAYQKAADLSGITDDSMLVERTGIPVKILEGSYRNIKITTPEDMIIAEALLKDMQK